MGLRTFRGICVCVSLLLFGVAKGQSPNILGAEAKIHRGFVLMHRQGVEHLVQGPVNIQQLNLFYTPNGSKDWHRYTHFPDLGLSVMRVETNSNELGNVYGILPYMAFTPHRGRIVDWTGQFAVGLGYFTKKWNRVENRKNSMIGSHFNLAVSLQTELQWHLSSSLEFSTGLSFTHFSNAGTTKPNLGINIPSASIGMLYSFNAKQNSVLEETHLTLPMHSKELVLLGSGFVNQYDVLDEYRFASTVSLEYGKFSKSKRSRIHGGIDIFYNGELADFYESEDIDYNKIHNFQVGVSAGYSRNIGNLSILLGSGIYTVAHKLPSLRIYNRLGLRYQTTNRVLINATVKTHLFVADYFELGLGYCIWKK